jgi:molybdate transport system substrate-binding protein
VEVTIMSCRLLALVVLAALGGCGKPAAESLELLCGSSFVKPMEELNAEFTAGTGIQVAMSVAGSEDFLPLVKAARRGDVLVTHDPYRDYVAEAKALGEHVQVGVLAPVLAVRKGNPHNLAKIDDLARPGLRVALTSPEYSTCGEMVYAMLEKRGLKDAVLANVGNRLTKGHGTIGTWLKTDAVDAAIMWNGVAREFGDAVEVVPTPYDYEREIKVHAMGLSYSRRPELVKKFIDFIRARGPAAFAAHGYTR